EPFELVRRLREAALATPPCFPEAREVVTLDGVRVEFANGFGLARPSNTTPVVVLRFEADDAEALASIQSAFRRAIDSVWPGLTLPF
ncbi:MAG: phosphomannomutase/phosphoglucomutase, partial [Thauera sp.]|nr:phosphomannomutase/phosphoglucomutase [Thauera sp.]